jgi:hypothetical protein
MTNIFDGAPDARQSDDVSMPTSRFRPRYRALTEDEKALHDDLKAQAEGLEHLIEYVTKLRASEGLAPQGRYTALALTSLEEAIMWAVKALTA